MYDIEYGVIQELRQTLSFFFQLSSPLCLSLKSGKLLRETEEHFLYIRLNKHII